MNKKNILYIFADQWRRQTLGFTGEDDVITPNIDGFSKESVFFKNAVSCYPVCSPHRASILTGLYPTNHGVVTNCKTGLNIKLKPGFNTIGGELKKNGYKTGYIGKWHLDEPELNHFENPASGATGWDAYTPPGPKRHGFDFWYSYGAADNHLSPHYWMDSQEKIQIKNWSVEHETDIALEFMEDNKDKGPFALFVSWNPPHTPFDQLPERYKEIYENREINFRSNVKNTNLRSIFSDLYNTGFYNDDGKDLERYTRDYFAAVTGVDDNFGRIINYLKKKGLYDNTIIVLSSDHGEMLGSHGLMNKNTWHEESIGIPFLIRNGADTRVFHCETVLNTVDQMPTILSLANIKSPQNIDGRDLSGVITGDLDDIENEAFIMACDGRGEQLQKYKRLGINLEQTGWRGIRTNDLLYVVYRESADNKVVKRFLYHLYKDPYQLSPEIIKNPNNNPVTKKLEERLKEYISNSNDPFPV